MWVCPKCGRSFKNTEQSHYCGKPPATIEEYIAAQPEEIQDYLRQINAAIKASIPEAREKISWSMPTYWKGRNLIQFAASKRHIGLYPGPEAVEAFRPAGLCYGDFFRKAPQPNPNRVLIKGVVCGVRVEEVEDPLMREIRYLDKLIDELAKGKTMEKILRK